MRDETLKALGELAGYQIALSQHDLLDEARDTNPAEFARLVEYSKTAESPIGSLISGAKRINQEAAAVAELRDGADADRAGKRVRSLHAYARSALQEVPAAHRREVLLEEFPWASPAMIAEALSSADAVTGPDEAWEKQQAWHAFERQVATLGEADALKWARQPGMWSFDVDAMIRHYEAEKAAGRMADLKLRMRKLYPWMADTWPDEPRPEPSTPDEPLERAGFNPPT